MRHSVNRGRSWGLYAEADKRSRSRYPWRKGIPAMTGFLAPQLEGDAREAVLHRSSYLQIVAFTFTERTAEE